MKGGSDCMSPVVSWNISDDPKESEKRWKQHQAREKIQRMREEALRQQLKKRKPDWLL